MKIIGIAFPIACFDMVMIKGGSSWQSNLDRNRDEMGQSRIGEWRTHVSDPLSPCIHLFLSIVTRDALSLSTRYHRLTDPKNRHRLFCFFFLSSLQTDRIWILCWSAKAHKRKTRPTKIYWRDVLNTAPFSSRNRITLVADYVHRSWVPGLWIS